MSANAQYQQRLASLQVDLAAVDRQGARIANARVVTFLTFAGFSVAAIFEQIPRWGLWAGGAALLAYVGLAILHSSVIRDDRRIRIEHSLNERGLLRVGGRWRDFEPTGTEFVEDDHLYAFDLDVVGHGSLFARLNETGTQAGEALLLSWLIHPPASSQEVVARQRAAQELAPMIDFRQKLITEARMSGAAKANVSRFVEWAEAPSALSRIQVAFFVAHILPVATVTVGILAANDLLRSLFFWVVLFIQIAINRWAKAPLDAVWAALRLGDHSLMRFEKTFQAIAAAKFSDPRLIDLATGLTHGVPVSVKMRSLARLLGFAELKQSSQMHPLFNALFMWDILVLFRLDAWRHQHGKGVRLWFRSLAEFEALSALATWVFEHPNDVFPRLDDGAAHFEATALTHPLIDRPIANDITLASETRALIISGSNMSGKTTFMRTMGLNAVIGMAGLPVAARSLNMSVLQVITSMRIKDSLERGVSYFYAEVQRVKRLMDLSASNPGKCFFLIDEILMGTNATERLVASEAIIKQLLASGAIGAVTTHDLSLCRMADDDALRIHNVHFCDQLSNGVMTFDYRIRDGVVQTSNAITVLRQAGITVPERSAI